MEKKEPSYDGAFFDAGRQYFEHGLPVWKEFVLNVLKAKSIADFGCGQGDWLEPLQGDISVWGCDGHANEAHLRVLKENFRKIDMCKAKVSDLDVGKRDVCMSLEAMEHLAVDHEDNFLDLMLSPDPRLVVFGVASGCGTYDPTQFKTNRLGEKIPGGPDWHPQWGRHHVNCQPVVEVIKKMAKRGYVVDDVLSRTFSELTTVGHNGRKKLAFASFYRKNTRVYRRMK